MDSALYVKCSSNTPASERGPYKEGEQEMSGGNTVPDVIFSSGECLSYLIISVV